MNKLNDGFKMKKLLIICILIIGIAFISGCVEEDTVPSAENVTPETPALIEFDRNFYTSTRMDQSADI
jgi:PBP1b-binding outer membrane lipoprotein LpoB